MYERTIEVRRRKHLPHWEADEGTYFVTFRLFNSFPRLGRSQPRDEAEPQLVSFEEHERLDEILDRGSGTAWMRDPRVAKIVFDAIRFFHGDRYVLHCGCVMPNHVHAVLRTAPGICLSDVMHSWKSYTAHEANKVLHRTGRFWLDDRFDSLLHDQNDLNRAIRYVMENPAKAGIEPWPWSTILSTRFRMSGGWE